MSDYTGWDRYHDERPQRPPMDLWFKSTSAAPVQRALDNEQLLRWEADFRQPNYYDWFLTEVTS